MKLKDMTTLSKVAKDSGKSKDTLRYRLKFLDKEDWEVLGKETILTPTGAKEILNDKYKERVKR